MEKTDQVEKTHAPERTDVSDYERERAAAENVYFAREAEVFQAVRLYKHRPQRRIRHARAVVELVRRLPWSVEEAQHYLANGEPPEIAPLVGQVTTGTTETITITASSYVSADTARRFYLKLQSRCERRARSKQDTVKGAAVLRFVLENTDRNTRPRWPELQELWNKTYREWRYSDRNGLNRAYKRAHERVIRPMQ